MATIEYEDGRINRQSLDHRVKRPSEQCVKRDMTSIYDIIIIKLIYYNYNTHVSFSLIYTFK